MAFDLSIITRQHVEMAVDRIEKDEIKLKPSTGYFVIINGKRYPPKEIIRYSYQIATGEDVGVIHGGKQVNDPLSRLGFEVIPKVGVWKLGCNWGRGAPSFYEAIKAKKIIIGHINHPFRKGDLILVTEGFTVYAIARLNSEPLPIKNEPDLEEFCTEYEVPYSDEIFYSPSEWYELKQTEIFDYQLIQGIRRVQDKDVKDKAIDFWENRDEDKHGVYFYKRSASSGTYNYRYPCIVFIFENIKEDSFQSSYRAILYRNPSNSLKLGDIKFLQKNRERAILPDHFDFLDTSFCSLGQSLNYYQILKAEFPDSYEQILTRLRDCAFSLEVRSEFESHPGYAVSLVKTSEAELALIEAMLILKGGQVTQQYSFTFTHHLKGAHSPHVVPFSFNMFQDIPNRFICIVGRNGTGKTQVINQLATKLYDETAEGNFEPNRPAFSKIIAVTFSYFDHFTPPKREFKNYSFIGINSQTETLSKKDITDLIWVEFRNLSLSKTKKELWIDSIKSCMEQGYLNFELDSLLAVTDKKQFIEITYAIFSSGQKIVFQLITRLISIIEENSLIIFDEPETHLHPTIAGRLIRSLKNILDKTFSFCILATHSPVIVQEIPSRFISIFDRRSNIPLIYSPPIECLGENLSNISNAIFGVDREKELYKQELERLVERGLSFDEINLLFERKLSLNAQLYIQTLIQAKNA